MVEKRNGGARPRDASCSFASSVSIERSPNEHSTAGTIIGPGPLITFFTWAKFEVTQISRRQNGHGSHSQSRESRRIRLTRTAGAVEACRRKNRRHTHTNTHLATHTRPSSCSRRCMVHLFVLQLERCGGATLVVPSRCSIFRAFRYFPINRRALASALSFPCIQARTCARAHTHTHRPTDIHIQMQGRKKHEYATYIRQIPVYIYMNRIYICMPPFLRVRGILTHRVARVDARLYT